MADEQIPNDDSGSPPPPPRAPKPPREPVTIEGQATDVTPPVAEPAEKAGDGPDRAASESPQNAEGEVAAAAASPPDAATPPAGGAPPSAEPAAPAAAPPEPAPPPRRVAPFVFGLIGAVIGVAAGLTGAYVFDPRASALAGLASRIEALDATGKEAAGGEKAAETRLAALEARVAEPMKPAGWDALEARVTKLESSAVKTETLAALQADVRDLRATAEKAAATRGTSNAPDPRVGELQTQASALEARLAKLEQAPAAPSAADPRVGELQSGAAKLAARVAKLEQAPAAPPSPDPRVAELQSGATKLAARVEKLEQTPAAPPSPDPRVAELQSGAAKLAARVEKLEQTLAAPPSPDPRVAELQNGAANLSDRISKLEAALAPAKAETRVAPIKPIEVDPVAQAVAALALSRRLAEGRGYGAELGALQRLGADADSLAALKPYAETGAPTPVALAAAFADVAPAIIAATRGGESADALDRLWDHMRALVRVRRVSEIPGETPEALVSQISAALGRGDVAAALTTYAKLPEPARAAGEAWAKDAEGFARAAKAAEALSDGALQRLANAKN